MQACPSPCRCRRTSRPVAPTPPRCTPGTAARIMTGAPLPPGADVIVQVERTDGGVEQVRIDSAPAAGVHVRTGGEDVQSGAVVLPAGTVIGPPQIGVAAALGFAELPVRRPLRVLVLSTGSELVEPGKPLAPGRSTNRTRRCWPPGWPPSAPRRPIEHFVADDVEALRAVLDRRRRPSIDLIVTSGGVSAGAYEVVKDALTGHGIEFAKVAMQPGMPQGAGRYRSALTDRSRSSRCPATRSARTSRSRSSCARRSAPRWATRTSPGRRSRAPLTTAIDSPAGKRQFRRGHLDTVGRHRRAVGRSRLAPVVVAGRRRLHVRHPRGRHAPRQPATQVEVWLLD